MADHPLGKGSPKLQAPSSHNCLESRLTTRAPFLTIQTLSEASLSCVNWKQLNISWFASCKASTCLHFLLLRSHKDVYWPTKAPFF